LKHQQANNKFNVMSQVKKCTKFILCILVIISVTSVQAQELQYNVNANDPILTRQFADTTPRRKVNVKDGIHVRKNNIPQIIPSGTTDTVWDLSPYLQEKVGCNFVKTIDDNGCIWVTYTDGFEKQICSGDLIEVKLANGKKYRRKSGQTIRHEVMRVPAPNPTGTETAYKWLMSYNTDLLDDIKNLVGTVNAFNIYLANERAVCNGMFYKQIDYRSIFIQEFLKAK